MKGSEEWLDKSCRRGQDLEAYKIRLFELGLLNSTLTNDYINSNICVICKG
jgi:hypothetical protein